MDPEKFDGFGHLLELLHLGPVVGVFELVRGDAKWATWADPHGFLGCSMLFQFLCVWLFLPITTVVVSVGRVNVLVGLLSVFHKESAWRDQGRRGSHVVLDQDYAQVILP